MTTIQYVFWDSDNTLVHTALHHWRKHVETLKTLGITLDEKHREKIYTNNGAQNWEWLVHDLGLALPQQEYLDRIDQWYFTHIGEIQLRSGIAEAIDFLESKNIPQAVVSNGRRRSVMAALEAKSLAPRFQFILCKEDYQGRKPGPEPYLAARTRMQQIVGTPIDPRTCLVIEDDPNGVESAKAAEMHVIHRPPEDKDTESFLAAIKTRFKSATPLSSAPSSRL